MVNGFETRKCTSKAFETLEVPDTGETCNLEEKRKTTGYPSGELPNVERDEDEFESAWIQHHLFYQSFSHSKSAT